MGFFEWLRDWRKDLPIWLRNFFDMSIVFLFIYLLFSFVKGEGKIDISKDKFSIEKREIRPTIAPNNNVTFVTF